MIVFDLRCGDGHVFEAWFASSAGYDEQRAAGLIACPVCGTGDVAKAAMAPNIAAKRDRAPAGCRPRDARAALAAIAAAQAAALATSEWVGVAFDARARAMHAGDEPAAPIHGQATREQARALIEDGVPVAPLIVPAVPPAARN